MIQNRACIICGKRLERKYYGVRYVRVKGKFYPTHSWEDPRRFLERKTCSKIGTGMGMSECFKKMITGSGNNNYKGIMPKCMDCGKKNSYPDKERRVKRCRQCYIESKKGIFPKHLKLFIFQKAGN